jgi:UPF0716 family protein affecting phage T7 exclusion
VALRITATKAQTYYGYMSVGIGAKLWVNFSVILVLLAGVAGFGLLQLQAAEATMDVLTSSRRGRAANTGGDPVHAARLARQR